MGRTSCLAILLLVLLLGLGGCGGGGEAEPEKSAVDAATDKAAETVVRKVRTPLDKAAATKNLGDERMKAMDEGLRQQQ